MTVRCGRPAATIRSRWYDVKDQLARIGEDQLGTSGSRERGLDLLLTVDRDAREPLRAQIERHLRDAIRGGQVLPGTVLPSTRALAAELAISRGVVVDAYAQLAAEGFIGSRRGGATRVLDVPSGGAGAPAATDAGLASGAATSVSSAGPPPINLLPMAGDLTAFPRRAWQRALRRALDGLPAPELSYGDPRGPASARAELAMYLARSRRVVASAQTTAFAGGVTQGMSLVAGALLRRGVRDVAVEDPGFLPHRAVLADAGLRTVPVAVDHDGLRVDELERLDVGAVLVTPAHQSPVGCALSAARRTALVGWAARRGAIVIEDDYDGEFRYDGVAIGALQGLAPDHVVYLGSVSKTLAPALRVGWIVAPAEIVTELAARRAMQDGGTPVIEPLALASLIAGGEYDRHLRTQRRRYALRRRAVLDALARELPEAEPVGVAAGLHVAVVLRESIAPASVMQAAADRGLLVLATAMRPDAWGGSTLVGVGFGQLADAAVDRAIATLASCLR